MFTCTSFGMAAAESGNTSRLLVEAIAKRQHKTSNRFIFNGKRGVSLFVSLI